MRLTLRSTLIAVAAALMAVLAFSATGVGAQENNNAYVGGEVQSKSALLSSAPAASSARPAPQVQGSSLAFTGSDATTVALLGAVAVIAGGSILLVRRRSQA